MIKHSIFIFFCCIAFLTNDVQSESIKIGASLALTGPGAEWGENAQHGIQLAAEKINSEGGIKGIPLEFVFEDFGSSDLKAAARSVQKFISIDKVKAILTQWSGDTEVIWPIAARADLITICIGPAPDNLTGKSPFVFRIWPSDENLIKAIADYAIGQKSSRPAMIGTSDPYFVNLTSLTKKYWKEQIGNDIYTQEIDPGSQDLGGIALRIKRYDPDLIFIHAPYDIEGTLINRLRESGIPATIVESQKSDDLAVISVAGKNAEGLIYPQYVQPESGFISEFKLKFNTAPVVPAEYAYDAVMLLARSMQDAGVDSTSTISKFLHSVANFKGASGTFSIGKSGSRLHKNVELMVIKNGKGELLYKE